MTRFAVLTDTFITGWANVWTDEDGYPLTFATLTDAQFELAEHLANSEYLDDSSIDDYKIVEVTE